MLFNESNILLSPLSQHNQIQKRAAITYNVTKYRNTPQTKYRNAANFTEMF